MDEQMPGKGNERKKAISLSAFNPDVIFLPPRIC